MSSALIGSLRVALGLDTAQFATGAKQAQGIASSLSSHFRGAFAGIVAGLSLAGVTAALKSSVDHMDELGKAAQKIGIPVDELSKLEYAARLSDVSLGDLQSSVGKLVKQLADMSGGGKNDASYALQTLGIRAVDANGKLRPTSQIIADIAAKFAGFRDDANKTALAVALFGKSGADMIPMLNGGRDAIAGAAAELERFGGVVTPQAAAQAEILNDNITRIETAFRSASQQIASDVVPVFNDLTGQFVDAMGGAENLESAISGGLKTAMVEITRAALEMHQVFFEIGRVWDVLAQNWNDPQGFSVAMERWNKAFSDVAASADDTKKRVEDLYKTINGTVSGSGKQSITNSAGALPAAPKFSLSALHNADAASARRAAEAERELKRAAEERAKSIQQIYESTRTPLEHYRDELKKLNDLFHDGKDNPELYARAVKQLQEEFAATAKAADDTAKKIEESFSSAFDSWIDQAIDGTFNLKNALNDLLGDLTKLLLHQAFQALLNPSVAPSQQGGGLFSGLIGSLFGGLFSGPSGASLAPQAISNKAARSGGPVGALKITQVFENHNGSAIEPNAQFNSNGELILRNIVKDEMGKSLPKALSAQYGITPNMRRR